MSRRLLPSVLLAAGSIVVAVLICEGVLRLLARPSPLGSAQLFGATLPPLKLIPDECVHRTPADPSPSDGLLIQGRRITLADLEGVFREDALVGYVPRENAISDNRWWQSNTLGARDREPITREEPAGRQRVLIFGDSYAAGSRVPQEETWASDLAAMSPRLEVIDFGVDGYSMGQSYLRYTEVRDRLDYDVVLLMFAVPEDLWREVNTMRALIGWRGCRVLPRYELSDGALRLVPSPFRDVEDVVARNRPEVSPLLRDHLGRYDSLYRPSLYRLDGPLGHSIIYRLMVAVRERRALKQLLKRLRRPDSEAVRISVAIFQRMRDEVTARGKRFVLVIVPTERAVPSYVAGAGYRREWGQLVSASCAGESKCVDLMPVMARAPADSLDRGYSGDHHGPRTNRLIARSLRDEVFPAASIEPTPPPGLPRAPRTHRPA